jgi:hypothetical protein
MSAEFFILKNSRGMLEKTILCVVLLTMCRYAHAQSLPVTAEYPQPWPTTKRDTSEHMLRSMDAHQTPESPFARAIARSATKSFIELGIEASTKALIDCQKETSGTLTTPFGRGESQQAHCFRF